MNPQTEALSRFNTLCRIPSVQPIVMITAYDALTARISVEAGIDILLIGDSMATVCLGYNHTSELPSEELELHSASVLRMSGDTPVIADITYNATQSAEKLLATAKTLIDLGCVAVKIEFAENAIEHVGLLKNIGIAVVGHIGVTPQTVHVGQALKAVGKTAADTDDLIRQAKQFESAGCCMLVLECITVEAVRRIKSSIKIPVIGIGSGVECDGQVLVFHDVIGWNNGFTAKFNKSFTDSQIHIENGVRSYIQAVRACQFPTDQHTYHQIK